MFGGSKKKKNSLAQRVAKLERKVAKKEKISKLKAKEAALKKRLYGR